MGSITMPKSLVGRVKNGKFAFFWMLIGGSIANILIVLRSPNAWLLFLPSAVLSILIAIAMADKTRRPKMLLVTDLLITSILLGAAFGQTYQLAILLPDALIIFGCVLGIMDW